MERGLVYIEWCDAITNHESWISEDEALKWAESERWVNKHVGFLIKETDEYLLLAGEIGGTDNDKNYGHVTKIPKTWIRQRTELNK